eukprot:TRINITY_DN1594_c0_g1_i1.p1 TRINITY_DN1594_c0_g1~~TRINITY_DN1594_c0_g1_i1.p1  ORF type:complete len:303 (-),score=51.21 TRINITY_DN1594_c0_g1_i1:62-859(-)
MSSLLEGPALVIKEGRMRKKGKDRWFILCGRTLYWFKSEPPLGSSEAYFKKKCQNSRVLTPSTVIERVQPKSVDDLHSFTLSISSPAKKEKNYTCMAPTLAELEHWLTVLKEAAEGRSSASGGAGAYSLSAQMAAPGQPAVYLTSTVSPDMVIAIVPEGPPDPSYFDGETNLMCFGWFHGLMTSDQAFAILETQPVGAYLVRVSAGRPASFVVSYVADDDRVIHVVWEWNDQVGWTAEGQSEGFDTVKDILLHYKSVYTVAVLRP